MKRSEVVLCGEAECPWFPREGVGVEIELGARGRFLFFKRGLERTHTERGKKRERTRYRDWRFREPITRLIPEWSLSQLSHIHLSLLTLGGTANPYLRQILFVARPNPSNGPTV
jgi:hypothetical protein